VLYKYASRIKSLDLSRNLSLDIPIDFIQSCPNLQSIVATHNESSKLQGNLVAASSLVLLDVSFNRMTELDSRTHQLTNLVSFIARSNRLRSLPPTFGRLINIRRINLSSNQFTTFPKELCDLFNLEDLDISFNCLESLPHAIGQLAKLQRLLINNNQLSGSLPETFSQLVSLREVDLRFNQLTNLEILSFCPVLESISAGHNAITVVDSKFPAARLFHLNKCPITKFHMSTNAMTLTSLDLSNAKLPIIPDSVFDDFINLIKLVLDNNHFTFLPPQLGNLSKLQHLSCTGNQLTGLPDEIGKLSDLRVLDLHSNNLKSLPTDVWLLVGLISLNASSNLLKTFPEPPSQVKPTEPLNGTLTSVKEEPTEQDTPRKNSQASLGSRGANTMAQSLKYLVLADNRLDDDCFAAITLLQGLRVLNLSFNDIYEVPTGGLRRLHHLVELYLSGNELTSLPSDDLEGMQTLRVLHVNANKLQSLPAEIGKIRRLMVLDVGSNNLKYNTANWPYDWNWNWNLDLKYLNFSGNKRLEIKPSNNATVRDRNLSDFGALKKLRVLGLMDLTLTIDSVPDESEDRRVRLSGSEISNMSYGQADTLGRNDHLSIIDMVLPRFQGQENEVIFGMFDGLSIVHGGSKIAKHLQDYFTVHLGIELKKLRKDEAIPAALRRAFLSFNKELGTAVTPLPVKTGSMSTEAPLVQALPSAGHRPSMVSMSSAMQVTSYISSALSAQDRTAGASVCLVYLVGKRASVANVGDSLAVLSRSDGEASLLSVKHNAGDASEVERIREAGGYVSRDGLVNDQSDVTRSVGYFHLTPYVQAAPHVATVELTEGDEFIIIASKALWDVMTFQTAVDIARSEREDLMLAAQKLRDFAISYGVQEKLSIMVIGVGDLFHRKAKMAKMRNASAARGVGGGFLVADEDLITGHSTKSRRRAAADQPADSTLARLTREVAPPVGEVAMIFTDIKNSTLLWESHPVAMRSAITIHNSIMRRQLRSIGGYEVKTEGDAFMVCFTTVTSALLWCLTVQTQLLTADWPQEILDSRDGCEVFDEESGQLLFRGLSVRMGIHRGAPVCEVNPITRRMDYFGPIVNRAARVSTIADGGHIALSSDVVRDIELLEKAHRQRMDHNTSAQEEEEDEEVFGDELTMLSVKKDMQMLKRIGFDIVPLGDRKLKGLENAEFVSLAYPSSLKARFHYIDKVETKKDPSQRVLNHENIIDVYAVVFRLENLCSMIRGNKPRHENRVNVLRGKIVKAYSAEDDDVRLAAVLENLLTRVENALAALTLHYSRSVSASLEDISMLPFDEVMLALQEYKARVYDRLPGQAPATLKEVVEEVEEKKK
jgi:adenylate cyclase